MRYPDLVRFGLFLLLAALAGCQSGKNCLEIRRKDRLEIWYANTQSLLCKDMEYGVDGPRAEDLRLVVANNSLRLVVDNKYTKLDDHFLTLRDGYYSVVVYSTNSSDHMILSFDTKKAENASEIVGTMSYAEEGNGSSKVRRWTLYLYSNNLVSEGDGGRATLNIFFAVAFYLLVIGVSLFPESLTVEFMLLLVSLTVFLQVPLQLYVLYFGYMTNFLVEVGLSAILAYYLNKLPSGLYLPYSIAGSMIWFYGLGRPHEIPQVALEVLVTLVPLYFLSPMLAPQKKTKTKVETDFVWKLAFLMIVVLIPLVSLDPVSVFLSIMHRSTDYASTAHHWWLRLLFSAVNLIVAAVAVYLRSTSVLRIEDLKLKSSNKYDLEEESDKRLQVSQETPTITSRRASLNSL